MAATTVAAGAAVAMGSGTAVEDGTENEALGFGADWTVVAAGDCGAIAATSGTGRTTGGCSDGTAFRAIGGNVPFGLSDPLRRSHAPAAVARPIVASPIHRARSGLFGSGTAERMLVATRSVVD